MTTEARPSYVREGFETVTPYLTVEGAERLIAFLERAFDGELEYRHDREDGGVGNAQVRLGASLVMISDATTNWPAWPSRVYLYVPDVDAAYRRALEHGAAPLMEPIDEDYGDRTGGVVDPLGNQWWLATSLEALRRGGDEGTNDVRPG
jgi:PhnB protein